MVLHGKVAFDESGFYLWEHDICEGWEFLIDFSYNPKSFTNPNLLVIPPVCAGDLLEIREIVSANDLARRFSRMQRYEKTQGRSIPELPLALTAGLLDELRFLHQIQWVECDKQRLALVA